MALTTFRKLQAKDDTLNQVQNNLEEALKPIFAVDILDGRQLSATLTGGSVDNLVAHGLGRTPRGWIVTDVSADTRIWKVTSTNPAVFLTLRSINTAAVQLWVF